MELDILFVTDFVCPYCIVAKAALEEALRELGVQAHILMQPLELTPEPKERVDTCHDEVRKARYQILVEPAAQLGIDIKLPPNVCPRPRTRLAWEGWYFADAHGCGEKYADLTYRAYFEKEQDLEDMEVLCSIAKAAGLDTQDFAKTLEEGVYTQAFHEADAYTKKVMEVKGIPAIYMNGEKIQVSSYTKEEMLEILQSGLSAMGDGGMVCGEDGCS